MKKYNNLDKHFFLIGIVLPILVFLISMNVTYAYFSSTTLSRGGDTTTSTVRIITQSREVQVNSVTYTNQKIVPGDTVTLSGILKNDGTMDVFVLIKLTIGIKKASETTETISSPTFYIINNNETPDDTSDDSSLIKHENDKAFSLASTKSVAYAIPYTFNANIYNDDYQNASATIYVNFYSIQAKNMGDLTTTEAATNATAILLQKAET